MIKAKLNEKLALACDKETPDLDEIKELIVAGADTNQLNKYNDNIFDDVFLEVLYDVRDDAKKLPITVKKIKEIISLMIDNGFDIKRFGLSTMSQFIFATYDLFTFDLYRFMLQYDLADGPEAYEDTLEDIGTEESYQRCCEHDHDLENLFYAIYEMVEAKIEGRNYKSIELYYGAVGLTIDKIVYFSDSNTMVEKKTFTEYNADIGFICGDKLLVMRDSVNILFMNDRVSEQPQIDISSLFGKDVIGRKIKSVSFDHKDVIIGMTYYGQPTIIIELTNGKKLKFTHNFGELSDKETQPRFWIE
ncbi:MAG: hypothetical protein IKJ17_00065 [Clostridia bacterium]|nr:hypothetical protein [Clostridia bacterium]